MHDDTNEGGEEEARDYTNTGLGERGSGKYDLQTRESRRIRGIIQIRKGV